MKNIIILLFSVILVSSASTPERPEPEFHTSITSDEAAPVEVSARVIGKNLARGRIGISGISVTITNTSDSVVRVRWEDSSIVYGENTHLVFLSGMKYIDAGKVFPVNAIPPGETLSTTVYSADQIIYHRGYWYTNAIRQTRTRVLIGIEYDGEMYFCSIESDLVNSSPRARCPISRFSGLPRLRR